jgi:hypothetical protein
MAEDFDKTADFGDDFTKTADFAADEGKTADFAADDAKTADFGEDFVKTADFIVAGNRTLMELLLALERTPADQIQAALPAIRRRAQRTRHALETAGADVPRLVNGLRGRGGDAVSASQGHEVHVHVHLHVNGDGSMGVKRR